MTGGKREKEPASPSTCRHRGGGGASLQCPGLAAAGDAEPFVTAQASGGQVAVGAVSLCLCSLCAVCLSIPLTRDLPGSGSPLGSCQAAWLGLLRPVECMGVGEAGVSVPGPCEARPARLRHCVLTTWRSGTSLTLSGAWLLKTVPPGMGRRAQGILGGEFLLPPECDRHPRVQRSPQILATDPRFLPFPGVLDGA